MSRSYEIDMCHGPLLPEILAFSLPLMFSNMIQLLFNAADTVVVGRFAGNTALAAVGSTTSLTYLLINIFLGLSMGSNVMTARYYGAKDEKRLEETVHTAISIALVGGILLVFIGFFCTRQILMWMATPDDVIDQASLYLKIYFLGTPFNLVYNFGSGILRGVGDTKHPLYYLSAAGVMNVVMNLFFVICLHMDVAGVALATIISQAVSAMLVMRLLIKSDAIYKFRFSRLRIVREQLVQIMRLGIPAGLQGCVFSISNILIQSSVNSFGSLAMAGNTASNNIENFVYIAMNTFMQTSMNFSSQNMGAGEQKRIRRSMQICLVLVTLTGAVLGWFIYLNGRFFLSIFSDDQDVIAYGLLRMSVIATTYFLCGIMDTIVGGLRGIGSSFVPMIISLIGACVFRTVWIFTVFQYSRSLHTLYISYPISWIITAAAQAILYVIVRKRQLKNLNR